MSTSGLPPPSGMPALGPAFRGSSVLNGVTSDSTAHHDSICDSASSALGNPSACEASSASPTYIWDVDGANNLVSPLHMGSKKKGGLFSGLKKMFQPQKGDGRSATGQGQRDVGRQLDTSVAASEGGAGFLDPSITKIDRTVKGPMALKTQTSRDLSLAALLTSPIRGPLPPASPGGLNSPMPPMRLEHAHSGSLPPDGDTTPFTTSSEQRLFPSCLRNTSSRALPGPSGEGSAHAGTLVGRYASSSAGQQLSSSLVSSSSLQLPAAPRMQSQASIQKSYSTALPAHLTSSNGAGSGASNGGSPNPPLGRGDSAEDYQQQQQQQQLLRGSSSNNSISAGRLALPYLASQKHRDASLSSPGRIRSSQMPEEEPEPPAPEPDEAAGEEEDDVPGSILLGMNPAVPAAMRRRRWSLDDFQVVKRMYKGQTSAVYRATCMRSGITVALKVYFLSRVPINVVHMIRREIELHVPLTHRNIVMLYAAFQDEKHIVLVEEFAARGDLFGIHRSMNCRLTETQTSELILAPFLDALAYLHARGIMHRDIKPENILFTQEWTLKIADFGVSINVHEERAVTRTGTALPSAALALACLPRTADYMAPEVERCPLKHAPEDNKDNPNLAYTPAIDIWSVGVLAYEMLVGFPPFVSNSAQNGGQHPHPHHEEGGGRPGAGVAAFMAEQATRKSLRFPASVSAAAKDFIMATLAENPGDRPTAQQLLKHPWLFKVARRPSISTSRFSNPNAAIGAY
ncbi:hypothetical protein Agub_g3055 [Astrephomene gubernaculifera]|uniref:Protein kinase domain-containing protein n=1 Tax=Astrephomene gubernaculifera TaxID=47775 RepID=A0AAD3DIA9_9CHLO|nr:hypothetical protein Agub_g3055 [Astrephomene gubernaculifera]